MLLMHSLNHPGPVMRLDSVVKLDAKFFIYGKVDQPTGAQVLWNKLGWGNFWILTEVNSI